MKKLLTFISFTAFLAFAGNSYAAGSTTSPASAAYGGSTAPCQPIYGGGSTCVSKGNITINKTVQNPKTKTFVDNLSLSGDPKYHPGDFVSFKLTVTNSGDTKLDEVTVKDTFPSFVTFVSGPGTLDTDKKVLTFKIFNLNKGESKSFTVKLKAAAVKDLPDDQAVNCLVNEANVTADDQEGSDVSQFCIESAVSTTKGGLSATDSATVTGPNATKGGTAPLVMKAPNVVETPATGPEMLPLLGLLPLGLGGLFLRKRSSK